jgi:hypothetical protein
MGEDLAELAYGLLKVDEGKAQPLKRCRGVSVSKWVSPNSTHFGEHAFMKLSGDHSALLLCNVAGGKGILQGGPNHIVTTLMG